MTIGKCEVCGSEMETAVRGRTKRYCSDKCRVGAWMKSHPRTLEVRKGKVITREDVEYWVKGMPEEFAIAILRQYDAKESKP